MEKRKSSRTAIRRRRIVAVIEGVLATIILCAVTFGVFELLGWIAWMLNKVV